MTVQSIYNYINEIAPFDTALGFDNVGLLVGGDKEIKSAYIVLDITLSAVEQAKQQGCELIISHHPVIFTPLKKVGGQSVVYKLAQNGMSAICAHTNLDAAAGGVNDCLCQELEIGNIQPLCDGESLDKPPMARMGEINPVSPKEFALYVKRVLGCGAVKAVIGNKEIKRVAVCGGAGGDFIVPAAQNGADALVTGECKHHERLIAKEKGITLIEGGHYNTECVVKNALAKTLGEKFPDVRFIVGQEEDCAVYF